MIRAVADANVIISGTIAPLGSSAAILQAWRAEYFELVTCPAVVEEVAEKLRQPRIRDKYHVWEEDVASLVLRLSHAALCVPGIAPVSPPPPDPDDTMLFAAAIEANAQYIITGDKALRAFAWTGRGRVVSPRQFWELELPSNLAALTLVYPVYVLEDIGATGFHTVESEQRVCLALFTSQPLVESYGRSLGILAEPLPLPGASHLSAYLRKVLESGCQWLAFNPVASRAVLQPIVPTIAALESPTSQV